MVSGDRSSALNKHLALLVHSCLHGSPVLGGQGEVGWSLSVGSPVEKAFAGGPQPTLPLFSHIPVDLLLILVSSLLPLEEPELGGRENKASVTALEANMV